MNYIERFDAVVAGKAEATAVVDLNGNRRTTYGELAELSKRVAFALAGKGVGAGRFVVLKMSRRMEFIAAALGVLRIGCAYAPVLPSNPEERIQQICRECDSAFIITDEFFQNLPEECGEVSLPDGFDAEAAPACLLFTSGTTGKPKGIVHSMRGFTSIVTIQQGLMPGQYPRTVLAEFSFVASTIEIFVSLLDGALLCMVDEKTRMSLAGFAEFIKNQNVDASFMTASHLKVLKSFSVLPKFIFLGGEKFPELDEEIFEQTEFDNVYGQSETLGMAITHKVRPGEESIPIGRPIDGLELRLLEDDGTEAAPGAEGEICLIGPYDVYYLNNQALTDEKFVSLPDGRQMIHTGDLGRLDENGELVFVARKDYMVKVNGMRVDVAGVESRLSAIPGVKQVAIKAVQNKMGNTCLAAYYTSDSGCSEEDVRQGLSKTLPKYMIPQFIIEVEHFTLNASGKIDKSALPDPVFQVRPPYEAPVNETEQKLCEIFQKSLGCEKVGRNDDFQQLGGDSLACMEILIEVEKQFDAQVDPTAIQAAPTPKKLAQFISGANGLAVAERSLSMFNVLVALAMILLPFVHFIGEFLALDMVSGNFAAIGEALELGASPVVFMLMVGYKLSFGERKPNALMKSGVDFLKLAFIFDFFRYIVTGLIEYAIAGDDGELFIYFASSDIYMFIALFYILFGLIKKVSKSNALAAAVPVVLLCVYYVVAARWGGSDGYVMGTLLGNFVYTGEYSFFPLFGWMFVPMIGYFCGRYIQKEPQEKEARVRRIGIVSACVLVVCAALLASGLVGLRDSYLSSLPELAVHICLTGVLVTFIKLPSGSKALQWLDRTGTLIMPYYMIHYVIIMFAMVPFQLFASAQFSLSPVLYVVLSLTVYVLSLLLAKKKGMQLMQKLLDFLS